MMPLMFNNKIVKIDILDKNDKVVMSAERNFVFPKNLGSQEDSILMIKGASLKEFAHNEVLGVVVNTKAGERIKYMGAVTVSMEKQLNIKIFKSDSTEVLQERRRYFKIKINEKGRVLFYVRDEDTFRLDEPEPIEVLDINIGGIFMKCECEFEYDDLVCIDIDLFVDYRLNAVVRILRVQRDGDGNILGYGCEFQGLTAAQEDYIGKYIYKTQSEQRQKDLAREDDNI